MVASSLDTCIMPGGDHFQIVGTVYLGNASGAANELYAFALSVGSGPAFETFFMFPGSSYGFTHTAGPSLQEAGL